MPVVTLLNMKGGVGKTSTCHHLAGTLSLMGKRVLLVDNDPQSSLSQGFWGPAATASLEPGETIAAVYAGDDPFPEQIIRPSGLPGVDLLPGSMAATRYNVPVPHESPDESQRCLRGFLTDVRDRYDLVLIDCPPNLHLCSWASLVASDFLVVPLQPEDYGSQGISSVLDSATTPAHSFTGCTRPSSGNSTGTACSLRRCLTPWTSRRPSPVASLSLNTSPRVPRLRP
jgi:chromosome partitioning protein